MPHKYAVIAVVVLVAAVSASADYAFELKGTWPESWPNELEPLREGAQTFVGGEILLQHFAIPFSERTEFESVWPHLLQVKTPGAPIILRTKSDFWLAGKSAGVCIHAPPDGERARLPKQEIVSDEYKWTTVYIELVVDGEIIDLNRIPLPRDTPIIDERFTGSETK